MPVHRIRLLGPWEFVWEGVTALVAPALMEGTTAMPRDWQSLFGPMPGTALMRRRFHCPTNLGPQDRVWLVCSGVRGAGTIFLNDSALVEFAANGEAVECELTAVLKPFNIVGIRLTVTSVGVGDHPAGLFEPVALEIRSE